MSVIIEDGRIIALRPRLKKPPRQWKNETVKQKRMLSNVRSRMWRAKLGK